MGEEEYCDTMFKSCEFFRFTLQVLSEVFSSVFENEDLPTPLHPLQGGLIKPTALLRSLRPLAQRPGSSSQVAAHKLTRNLWIFSCYYEL